MAQFSFSSITNYRDISYENIYVVSMSTVTMGGLVRYYLITHCIGAETHAQLVIRLLQLLILHSSPGTLELQELLELWDGVA